MLWSVLASVLLHFVGLVLSLDTNACDNPPTWVIEDLNIKTLDEVGSSGSASFNLTNSMTGKTDSLTCALVANYRCEIDGTPSDQDVRINMQIQTDVARMSISETMHCDDEAS